MADRALAVVREKVKLLHVWLDEAEQRKRDHTWDRGDLGI